jgi:mono/diheme cytochrome c family protein
MLILVGILLARAHLGDVPAQTHAPGASNTASSVLNGVYTEAQRKIGILTYLRQCSSCHGERLRGGESAPALTGADFRKRWDGQTLDDLLHKVMLMPPNDPGKLTPEENASLITVILAFNGFPAGPEELPSDTNRLQQIRIESARTPQSEP